MFRNPFEQFPSATDFFGADPFVIWLNIIGLALISITFFVIGMIMILMAEYPSVPPKTKRAIVLTRMFGFFLVACAFARGIDILSYWHNFPIFNGWIRVVTGIIAGAAIYMIPGVIRETKQSLSLKEAGYKLDSTKEKLERVEQISRKLDQEDDKSTTNK